MTETGKPSPEDIEFTVGRVRRKTRDAKVSENDSQIYLRNPDLRPDSEEHAKQLHEKALRLQEEAASDSSPEVVDVLHNEANRYHLEDTLVEMIDQIYENNPQITTDKPIKLLGQIIWEASSLERLYQVIEYNSKNKHDAPWTNILEGLRSPEVEAELKKYYDGKKENTHNT